MYSWNELQDHKIIIWYTPNNVYYSHPHPTRTIWNTRTVQCILYNYFNTNYFFKSNSFYINKCTALWHTSDSGTTINTWLCEFQLCIIINYITWSMITSDLTSTTSTTHTHTHTHTQLYIVTEEIWQTCYSGFSYIKSHLTYTIELHVADIKYIQWHTQCFNHAVNKFWEKHAENGFVINFNTQHQTNAELKNTRFFTYEYGVFSKVKFSYFSCSYIYTAYLCFVF